MFYATKNVDGTPPIKIKQNFYKNTFFQSAIIEWNKLDSIIRNAKNFFIIRSNILKSIRPTPKSFFNYFNHKEIRLLTLLCLGLIHLREHKFNHNIQNCINPLCSCGVNIESASHFFLRCPLFDVKRITLLSTLSKTDCNIIDTSESSSTETLMFGNLLFFLKKTSFLTHSLIIFSSTERFEELLL